MKFKVLCDGAGAGGQPGSTAPNEESPNRGARSGKVLDNILYYYFFAFHQCQSYKKSFYSKMHKQLNTINAQYAVAQNSDRWVLSLLPSNFGLDLCCNLIQTVYRLQHMKTQRYFQNPPKIPFFVFNYYFDLLGRLSSSFLPNFIDAIGPEHMGCLNIIEGKHKQ